MTAPTPTEPSAERRARAHTTFTDLNPDILLHIAAFISPSPSVSDTLGVHWLNVPRPTWGNGEVRALRAVCRYTREVIPQPSVTVRIRDEEGMLARWVGAPQDVLGRVKRITLSSSARGDHFVSPATAQVLFETFTTALTRCPSLEIIEIAHNPFCPHDAYGLGLDRIFSLTSPVPIELQKVHTLSIALKCRICAVEFARTLSSWCPSLLALRASVVTFVPPARVLPSLTAHLQSLRTLYLKVGEEWALASLLACLPKRLAELHIAPYDASRKVQVVDSLQTHDGMTGDGVRDFLDALGAFTQLEELDLCLSPVALSNDPLLGDDERGLEWRRAAADTAMTLIEVCPTLRRGWWWIQVVDLDYRQLKGYERWPWWLERGGDVVVAEEPRHLAPLVVRNQDGQGTTVEIPSEEWY